jgi:hypothetical protein
MRVGPQSTEAVGKLCRYRKLAREAAQDPALWLGEVDSGKVCVVRVNSSPAVLIFGEVQSGNCEEVLL